MRLGIRPLVDFAFKMIFGSPENMQALIGLLNAILCFEQPIVTVQIKNPFNYKEFEQAKHIMLDIRATDSGGRSYNIEMQIQTAHWPAPAADLLRLPLVRRSARVGRRLSQSADVDVDLPAAGRYVCRLWASASPFPAAGYGKRAGNPGRSGSSHGGAGEV